MTAQTVPKLAHLRADSAIWLVVALTLFFISTILMLVVTHVERHPNQIGFFLSVGGDSSSEPPTIAFNTDDGALKLEIHRIDDRLKTISFGPFQQNYTGNVVCAEHDDSNSDAAITIPGRFEPATPEEVRLSGIASTTSRSYELEIVKLISVNGELMLKTTVTPQQFGTHAGRDVGLGRFLQDGRSGLPLALTCNLPNIVMHNTFTSRAFQVSVRQGLVEPWGSETVRQWMNGGRYLTPESVSFTDEDAEEIHVTNLGTGETRLTSTIVAPLLSTFNLRTGKIEPATTLKFTWDSITAGQYRDMFIIVIGVLFGLGASAILEAVRPYIAILVSVRNRKTSIRKTSRL